MSESTDNEVEVFEFFFDSRNIEAIQKEMGELCATRHSQLTAIALSTTFNSIDKQRTRRGYSARDVFDQFSDEAVSFIYHAFFIRTAGCALKTLWLRCRIGSTHVVEFSFIFTTGDQRTFDLTILNNHVQELATQTGVSELITYPKNATVPCIMAALSEVQNVLSYQFSMKNNQGRSKSVSKHEGFTVEDTAIGKKAICEHLKQKINESIDMLMESGVTWVKMHTSRNPQNRILTVRWGGGDFDEQNEITTQKVYRFFERVLLPFTKQYKKSYVYAVDMGHEPNSINVRGWKPSTTLGLTKIQKTGGVVDVFFVNNRFSYRTLRFEPICTYRSYFIEIFPEQNHPDRIMVGMTHEGKLAFIHVKREDITPQYIDKLIKTGQYLVGFALQMGDIAQRRLDV